LINLQLHSLNEYLYEYRANKMKHMLISRLKFAYSAFASTLAEC